MVLLKKLIATNIPNKPKVLDAGCGNGNFVIDELTTNLGYKVGVDIKMNIQRTMFV